MGGDGQPKDMADVALQLNLAADGDAKDNAKYIAWFQKVKENIDIAHGKYPGVCKENGLQPSEVPLISGWQTWDTPNGFISRTDALTKPQKQLKALCFALRRSLSESYKGTFGFENLRSDKESYTQSASIIGNLCEDPQAAVMFEKSFAKLGKKCDPTKITISLCGAGSSKVHVNKYILSQRGDSVGKKALAPPASLATADVQTFELSSRRRRSRNKSIDFKPATYVVNLTNATVTQGFKKSGKQDALPIADCFKDVQFHDDNGKENGKTGKTAYIARVIQKLGKEWPCKRRRMAQREYSSRRDSPVMVRLLEEITEANRKHNELN